MNSATGAVRAATVVPVVVGFLAALYVARLVSWSLDDALFRNLPGFLSLGGAIEIAPPLVFLVCAVWFYRAVRNAPGPAAPPRWRRLDYGLVVVWAWGVLLFVANWYLSGVVPSLALMMVVVLYAVGVAFLAEMAARRRDGDLWRSFVWRDFFTAYPLSQPIGVVMALLVGWNALYLFVVCPLALVAPRVLFWRGFAQQINLPLFLLAITTISALTYLCAFVLSLSRQYAEANEEALRSERFKAELITNVSHDIRTPLTSIINYVNLLGALPVTDKDFRQYVDVLDRKSKRLNTLIDDLMEASKAATGNLPVTLREVDLVEIAGQIAGEFDDQFSERGLTLVSRSGCEGSVLVTADSDHLWRVLENLYGNAAKYALAGTRVFAEIGQRQGATGGGRGRTAFVLKNTSADPIEAGESRLVEQFIRGDAARHAEGHGLGLHIAKSLVELMGGEFTIRADGDLFSAEVLFP